MTARCDNVGLFLQIIGTASISIWIFFSLRALWYGWRAIRKEL